MATRHFVIPLALFIGSSYSVYFFFDRETVELLGADDNLFENLTALFFLCTSVFFYCSYRRTSNAWFLLLSVVMFIGCGEEISWGQRIFDIETPEFMSKINVQNEINIHNIEIFNGMDFDRKAKAGLNRLLSINFLYKLFWLLYCVVTPIVYWSSSSFRRFFDRINLPIPELFIGIFFPLNWLIFKFLVSFILPTNESAQYYDTAGEIRECGSAFIFMVLAIHFYVAAKQRRLNERSGSDS